MNDYTLYIHNGSDYVEAKPNYGITLGTGALANIMAFVPLKEPIKNDCPTEHGSRITLQSTPKWASRDITIPFNITASNRADWLDRYAAFQDLLSTGRLSLKLVIETTIPKKVYYYHFVVQEPPSQYTQYMFDMASFTLKLTEPNPADRGETSESITTLI